VVGETFPNPGRSAPADIVADMLRLQQLCAETPDESGSSVPLTTAAMSDLLESDDDEIERVCRWLLAATQAATEMARRPEEATLGWKIAKIARRIATVLLRCKAEVLSEGERNAVRGAMINLLGALGQAAQSRGHHLGKAVVAVRLIEFWNSAPLDGSYAQHIALVLEEAVRHLVESARFEDAKTLIALAPVVIKEAHYHWDDVEQVLEVWTKPAWAPPTSSDETTAYLRRSIEYLAMNGSDVGSSVAREVLARLDGQMNVSPEHLLEIAAWLETQLEQLGHVDAVAKLRFNESFIARAADRGHPEDTATALSRLADIAGIHARAGRWEDAAIAKRSQARLLLEVGKRQDASTAFLDALELTERQSRSIVTPFAAGAAERARIHYESVIDSLCQDGQIIAALRLAEHAKCAVWRQTGPAPSLKARDVIEKTETTDLRGFVSFFIGKESCLLFCVDARNDAHVERLDISRVDLVERVARLTPNGWTTPGAFLPSGPRALRALDELVAPLLPLLDDPGRSPDELVFSPDGILHNIPWHLLRVGSSALIERVPIRTVLGLDHKKWLLSDSPVRPRTAAVFVAPAEDQQDRLAWDDWSESLGTLCTRCGIEVQSFLNTEGSPEKVIHAFDNYDLTHVRCHGHFPEGSDVNANAAFATSGLLLPVLGHLLKRFADAQPSLTPAMVLNNAARLTDRIRRGHVALEACVSGVVRDGAAGDPISLPWVLSFLGVTSVSASHWNVASGHARLYFETFYNAWLGDGVSRTKAHQAATLTVLERFGEVAAAFKLIGDGR
jgi:CHAT domain-containing protein/urease accessory protein UreF